MQEIENSLFEQGMHKIAGLDEAGRGPLAGPVVAAAVIFPAGVSISKINDSKKLSHLQRERLYPEIVEQALSVGVGIIGESLIDQINILEASRVAMFKAVQSLAITPDYLLIDGNFTINSPHPQRPIVRGDSLSISIAAASIVAKVTRDRLMSNIHDQYPQYQFAKHKGYGTREHLSKIKEFGPCKVHRKTFRGVKEWIGRTEGVH